ncbi:hypothetical protein D3C76_1396500 [compost metagenome]
MGEPGGQRFEPALHVGFFVGTPNPAVFDIGAEQREESVECVFLGVFRTIVQSVLFADTYPVDGILERADRFLCRGRVDRDVPADYSPGSDVQQDGESGFADGAPMLIHQFDI